MYYISSNDTVKSAIIPSRKLLGINNAVWWECLLPLLFIVGRRKKVNADKLHVAKRIMELLWYYKLIVAGFLPTTEMLKCVSCKVNLCAIKGVLCSTTEIFFKKTIEYILLRPDKNNKIALTAKQRANFQALQNVSDLMYIRLF